MSGNNRKNRRRRRNEGQQQPHFQKSATEGNPEEDKESAEYQEYQSHYDRLFSGTDDWNGIDKDPNRIKMCLSDDLVQKMFGAKRPEEKCVCLLWDPNDTKTARLMAFNPKTALLMEEMERADKDGFEMRMSKLVESFPKEHVQEHSEPVFEGSRTCMPVTTDKVIQFLNLERQEPLLSESDVFESDNERRERNLSTVKIIKEDGKEFVELTVASINYFNARGYMPQLVSEFDYDNDDTGFNAPRAVIPLSK